MGSLKPIKFQRERLVLCSLLYHSVNLFKLALQGVEILLPNYLMAADIILTESMKVRLHPSIDEVEVRHACLLCFASILPWPSTFGTTAVVDGKGSGGYPNLTKQPPGGGSTGGVQNVLEVDAKFIDLRARMLQTTMTVLKNESDASNIQLALGNYWEGVSKLGFL